MAALKYTLNNPNNYGTGVYDRFGNSIDVCDNYTIVGTRYEDSASYSNTGVAYVFSNTTGLLVYTLENPNDYGTPEEDGFGASVAICDSYSLVGASEEDNSTGERVGVSYLFDNTDGSLLYTFKTTYPSQYDAYGTSLSVCEAYSIIGSYLSNDVVVFSNSTGLLVRTHADTIYSTISGDYFGNRVDMCGDYYSIGAHREVDSNNNNYRGAIYIYSTSSGALLHSIENPSPTTHIYFGKSIAVSSEYTMTSAYNSITERHMAYLYDNATGNLIRTFVEPNDDGEEYFDFGYSLGVYGDYCVISSSEKVQKDGGELWEFDIYERVYIFRASTGVLVDTILSPYEDSVNFGTQLAIYDDCICISAILADGDTYTAEGIAFIYEITPLKVISEIDAIYIKVDGTIYQVDDVYTKIDGSIQTITNKYIAHS